MGRQVTLDEMIAECEKEINERRERGQESLGSRDEFKIPGAQLGSQEVLLEPQVYCLPCDAGWLKPS